jgi:hypothetical protein
LCKASFAQAPSHAPRPLIPLSAFCCG